MALWQTTADKIKEKIKAKIPAGPTSADRPARKGKSAGAAVDAHYDQIKKTFWVPNARGEYIDVTETNLKRMLRAAGLSSQQLEGMPLTQVEEEIMDIIQTRDVHYAGPLAGYKVGRYEIDHIRLLITRGPRLHKPVRGQCPTIKAFIEELLGMQAVYFNGWLKAALQALHGGYPFAPGQMLAVAGPAGSGKSLLQDVITEALGGRVAKPYRYMIGETTFNGDLLGAEHLAIEDEAASTDMRTRRVFGAMLKNLIVNQTQSWHAKGKDAMTLRPFWRVSFTLNEEVENLMVLPPLDESLLDKVILLRAKRATLPFDSGDSIGRKNYRDRLSAELPAFLGYLQAWAIPPDLQDQRFGIKAYQNPGLVTEVENLEPQYRLLALIETLGLISSFDSQWVGTAADLERVLREKDKTGEVGRLLWYNTAAGQFLAKLVKRYPERFSSEKIHGKMAVWTIKAPPG